MKKLNHTLLKTVAMFTILFMVACSNDDDAANNNDANTETPDAFIGNWKAIGYMEGDEYINIEDDECESGEMIVNDDFTGTLTVHDCNAGDEITNFEWLKTTEGVYSIIVGEESSNLNLTFEDDTMTFSFEGDPEYTVFKRQ